MSRASGALLDPRNGPAFDLPPPRAPEQRYVIASLPRTGSTLLCRALWDTGRVGAPKEYLNPMQLRDWSVRFDGPAARLRYGLIRGPLLALVGHGWSAYRRDAHLSRVRARRSGPEGHFGLKLHFHHFQRFYGGRVESLGPARWILLTRADPVAQAVSWARAQQTGAWASTQRADLPPVYSRRRIQRALDRIHAFEAGWRQALQAAGVSPLHLTYEQLDADLTAACRRVLGHLGFRDADAIDIPAPTLVRQADGISADWIRRFRSG
ncbi:MAG: hypothetical protein H6739_39385 [Alphaproteobacteria bacterium]|nr:hypothetical protein [Alphaproteobacteria bacterium]